MWLTIFKNLSPLNNVPESEILSSTTYTLLNSWFANKYDLYIR